MAGRPGATQVLQGNNYSNADPDGEIKAAAFTTAGLGRGRGAALATAAANRFELNERQLTQLLSVLIEHWVSPWVSEARTSQATPDRPQPRGRQPLNRAVAPNERGH